VGIICVEAEGGIFSRRGIFQGLRRVNKGGGPRQRLLLFPKLIKEKKSASALKITKRLKGGEVRPGPVRRIVEGPTRRGGKAPMGKKKRFRKWQEIQIPDLGLLPRTKPLKTVPGEHQVTRGGSGKKQQLCQVHESLWVEEKKEELNAPSPC